MLQADSEKLRQAWVQAVQASIASAYRESPDSCYSEVWPSSTCHACAQGPCGLHVNMCVHASVRVHCMHACSMHVCALCAHVSMCTLCV